ncbi:MAG TPA: YihY/virulence factor BrkB family protein [Dyella sp.]|uniref:YihY/virulence factor BrkB family protein n=1 Tax=Dyella sp. TaxID=1869338 RepID=UPI002F94A218
MRRFFRLIRDTLRVAVDGFLDDELMTRASALAFWSSLSFAPILVLTLWSLSVLRPSSQDQLVVMLAGVLGREGAAAVKLVLDNARQQPRLGNILGLIGVGVTVFSASTVFAQLQSTLNRIFGLQIKPGARHAVLSWLSMRARAVGLLIGIFFLLIVSFVVSAIIQGVMPGDTRAWQVFEIAVSLLVFVLAFGAMYKVLPDANIPWRDASRGAVLTAVLFVIGQFAIGIYLDRAKVGGAYGPAGAIVVLLTWMYYASVIVLLGAELTHGLAVARGARMVPNRYAQPMDDDHREELASSEPPEK